MKSMKKLLIIAIIFIVCITSYVYSQNLALSETMALCNKSEWDGVNEYLLKKGWEYHESSKGDDDHYSTITWSYNKENYGDKAHGWFYLYTYKGLPNKIRYSFSNKLSYNTLKKGISISGMKQIDNMIGDNEIETKYANSNFIVSIKTEKRERKESYDSDNSVTAYTLEVIKKSGIYDNENGLKKIYDINGNIESEYTLKDTRINGLAKAYYSNGQVKVVSTYINGTKHGGSKEYDEEGNLTAEYNYLGGEPSGAYKIYENGKLKMTGGLLNGDKNGLFKVYDEEERIDKEYNMKLGFLDGAYAEYYYEEGKLLVKVTGFYANDQKTGLWQTIKIKEKGTELIEFKTYVNDKKNGAFKEVSKDSIIFGAYKNGILDGSYKVYRSLTALLLGGLHGDTTNCALVATGSYNEGQKNGYWKYYSWSKGLIKEGRYYNDLESGEWKYYFENYVDEKGKQLSYSGKLFLIENYADGKKSGKEMRYAYLKRKEVPCDTTGNRNVNPLDTCHKMVYQKVFQTSYYKNGDLYGPIEYKDSAGVLRYKGNFVNGEKDGFWIESYTGDALTNFDNFYSYKKGNYSLGKRIGQWTLQWNGYTEENKVQTTYNYKNGLLDGKIISLHDNGKSASIALLENGNMKSVQVYDSLGVNIIRSYELTSETSYDLKCIKTEVEDDGSKVSQEYWIKKNRSYPVDPEYFELFFAFRTGRKSDGTTGFPDGQFKLYNSNNKIITEGFYSKETKTGKWKFYYDSNVFTEQDFSNNVGSIEKYFVLATAQPFSGKFIQKFANGKIKYEYKISDGLRDGKSKYYDENGNVIKTEKYKKGILLSL